MLEPGWEQRVEATGRKTGRHFVIAPDSFKGSIAAADAARSIAQGWMDVRPHSHLHLRPMADGGEGTLDAFAASIRGARAVPVSVPPPAGAVSVQSRTAYWLLLPRSEDAPLGSAVVELASTCGIELYGDRREPWRASTYAFGVAIASALDFGVSRLILAIGSSASTDGGAGMLEALGADIIRAGDTRAQGAHGLRGIRHVDLTQLRQPPPGGVVALSDVSNGLLGAHGAAAVFGAQKGFEEEELAELDVLLGDYASKFSVNPDAAGAGAAGGTGFALLAWGAKLSSGAEEVARMIGLPAAIGAAQAVITGEGFYDGQTSSGKAPARVARLAADVGVPAGMIAGQVAPDADASMFDSVVSLTDMAGSVRRSLATPRRWLRLAGAELAEIFG